MFLLESKKQVAHLLLPINVSKIPEVWHCQSNMSFVNRVRHMRQICLWITEARVLCIMEACVHYRGAL
jgi:hypothetical protein